MKKHWLAIVGDQDLSVARIAVGKNKDKNEMKLLYHAQFPGGTEALEAAKVKAWLKGQKVPVKKLKLAVSSRGLMTRVISLPYMSGEELESLIMNNTDRYLALDIDNYIVDYRILKKYRSYDQVMADVLIVALPKERMDAVWTLCEDLGFEPRVIDLTADCLARIYSRFMPTVRITRSPEGTDNANVPGDMAIVCLYRDKAEFVLLENNIFFLYADMDVDIADIARRFAEGQKRMQELQKETEQLRSGVLAAAGSEFKEQSELLEQLAELENLYANGNDGTSFSHVFSAEASTDLNHGSELFHLFPDLDANQSDDLESSVYGHVPDEVYEHASVPVAGTDRSKETFVLEDLFVPYDQLKTELPIAQSHQELQFSQHESGLNTEVACMADRPQSQNVFNLFDLNLTEGLHAAGDLNKIEDPREVLANDLEPVLAILFELLGSFAMRHYGRSVSAVYLTGDYAGIPHLEEIFETNLGINTRVGFPDNWKPQCDKRDESFHESWKQYGCLYGLALRED